MGMHTYPWKCLIIYTFLNCTSGQGARGGGLFKKLQSLNVGPKLLHVTHYRTAARFPDTKKDCGTRKKKQGVGKSEARQIRGQGGAGARRHRGSACRNEETQRILTLTGSFSERGVRKTTISPHFHKKVQGSSDSHQHSPVGAQLCGPSCAAQPPSPKTHA